MEKRICTIGFIFYFIIGVVFTANASTQTYNVPNSPFVITKQTFTVQVPCTWGGSVTENRYQYYLSVKPEGAHAALQRIEYVGFRVVYNNTMRYFQLYPNGGTKELTDPSQALYEPSKIVLSPGSVGIYQLFSHPIPNDLQATNGSVCLDNGINFFNLPNPTSIKAINFMAGYGFLTPQNLAIIAQQKALENDPRIQQQIKNAQTMNIQTMKWALAQGNMFKYKEYYNIFDLTYGCNNTQQSPCNAPPGGAGGGI
ncbi:MAG: hypothetical protein KKD32_03740 [Proteobacteria bacterium]|nr:hypothetical protein [Pseudomonadota bacterium]MBU1586273.1 hypothetical protein [Pseudomonadota bacterium]MBU2453169.1 hypothetical protein [Pseudomonadota bacterium]MBU2630800.1 hypothetical protein [Pseudomonadota bacterium]